MIKVVHLCSSNTGGAGIAAHRLNKALRDYGIDSRMLCLNKNGNDPSVEKFNIPLISRILNHIPIPYRQNKYKHIYNELSPHYESLTFPEAIFDISGHHLIEEADIINLHWVGGMLNYPLFFRKIKKPIVWTLHDMNPFQGFAHYQGDLERNPQDERIEKKIRNIKTNSYSHHKSISIVNLCKWMYDISSTSEAFKNRQHHIIPNSINTNLFKVKDKQKIREILGIPNKLPVLLFCSQTISNPRKGFDILAKALQSITQKCVLVAIGNNPGNLQKTNDLNLISLGTINDDRYLSLVYSAADAFVLPSREDNLPNTMLESLCCGIPVIAFANGGMKDVVVDGRNGLIVKEQTSEALASAIDSFICNAHIYSPQEISNEAHMRFNPKQQAIAYEEVYQSLLINRNGYCI